MLTNMLEDAIRKWNPWWADVKNLNKLTGVDRDITHKINNTLDLTHIKDVIGVRRSGKTTILYQIVQELISDGLEPDNIVFLNFDDPDVNAASFEDLVKTVEKLNPGISHVFLDEIQQKKEWERWIRTLYDTKKFNQIFISGSASSLLSRDVGRVLSGRHITFTVFPFSFKEYLFFKGWNDFSKQNIEYHRNKILHHLKKFLENGGFPETIDKDEYQKNLVLTNVYNDVLARDITARFSTSFEIVKKIGYHLLSNVGNEFSFRSIARSTDVSIETAEKYLNFLEESFILFTIHVFSYKTKVQFKQNKKVYCVDTGLRNTVSFKFSKDLGHLAENMVFVELKRSGKEVYYWKDGNVEVDFVVKKGNQPIELYQVCWDVSSEKTKKREIGALIKALDFFKLKKAMILTEDHEEKKEIEGKQIFFVPLWKWLLLEE